MKKLLLTIMAVATTATINAQISTGLINDFEDGTTQGWSNGGASPNPPANIADGGPNGAGDNYLEEMSAGGSGAGSRLAIFNVDSEWQGDYITAGAEVIRMNVRNSSTANNINLRIAISGGSDDTELSTTAMELLTPSTDWTEVTFDIQEADLTVTNGTNTIAEVLADVQEIRILSNPNPSFIGESVEATLDVDNIQVESALSIQDQNQNLFQIFPNPATDRITITSNNLIESYRVISVLGKIIMNGTIDNRTQEIDISSLNAGLYLVEVTANGNRSVSKLVKR